MNSDIKKAVEIINHRITNLQQIKTMLLEEFDVQGASAVAVAARPIQGHSGNGNGNQTRVQQLKNFLIQNGPSKRAAIIAGAGMPKGTIASLLNREEFVRRSDGKWQVDEDTKAVQ
jgi:hypothetical protein